MRASIKMTKSLCNEIRNDLLKPHPFAGERVGFLFVRQSKTDFDNFLLISTQYTSLPDNQYIYDSRVGAKINSTSIRNAMQRTMETNEGVLHIHMHDHIGEPGFSYVDKKELRMLIKSFQNANNKVAHGAMVFSHNEMFGIACLPGKNETIPFSKISTVGYPLNSTRGGLYA